MNTTIIATNKPYPFQLPATEGAISDFLRPNSNRLLLALNGINKDEEKHLRKGTLRCGLLAKNGAILFLWQFTDKQNKPIFTFDSQFDARLIKDIQLYDVKNSETRIAIDIHIVDLSTQLVRGLRSITMPPGLTVKFLSDVQDQLSTQQSGNEQIQQWTSFAPQELSETTQMWLLGK